MARRSLKPQLNQIRIWVREGRTDAWIAHQLDVSVSDIRGFKGEHDLAPAASEGDEGAVALDQDELDLRAEDDALVAAALEAEAEEGDDEPEDEPAVEEDSEDEDEDEQPRGQRRRGRRGGRRRRGRGGKRRELEGTFDHGDEGYGLWLDPAVQEDPVYAEHWAGHRPVTVSIEAERIVITRAGEEAGAEDDE